MRELSYKVDLDAPRDLIWDALTRPEHLTSWLCSRATVDPVVGGAYDLCWEEGEVVAVAQGEVLSIDRPRLLQLAWRLGDDEVELKVALFPTPVGTRLELSAAPPGEGEGRAQLERIWSGGLERLKMLFR